MKVMCCERHLPNLKCGEEYEVTGIRSCADIIFYELDGIVGAYDSKCFMKLGVKPRIKVKSSHLPKEGRRFTCYYENEGPEKSISTSPVKKICPMGDGRLIVETKNSIYIVKGV